MTRRFLLLVLVATICLGAGRAAAQTPFALRNIGQRVDSDDARMVARGWGMTVTDSLHPGFKNVASLSSLRHVALKFTGYGERFDSEDIGGSRRTYRTFAPDIRVGIPVIKGRLGITAGFNIERSAHWATRTDTSWVRWDEEILGNHQFIREGSMFSVPLGGALQVLPGISLGGSVNLRNGVYRDAIIDVYLEPYGIDSRGNRVPFYVENAEIIEETFHGTSVTWALLLAPGRRVRLAGSYTGPYDLRVDRKAEMEGVSVRTLSSYNMLMPAEYRAGVEIRPLDRWRIGGDAQYMEYSALTGNADWEPEMEDEYSWSAGVERVQAQSRHGGWSNLPLRLGYRQLRWAYTVGGSPVDERIYSIGTGFPFRQGLGQLDLALSWIKLGDLAQNGTQSEGFRLTLSVTGLEAWW